MDHKRREKIKASPTVEKRREQRKEREKMVMGGAEREELVIPETRSELIW